MIYIYVHNSDDNHIVMRKLVATVSYSYIMSIVTQLLEFVDNPTDIKISALEPYDYCENLENNSVFVFK